MEKVKAITISYMVHNKENGEFFYDTKRVDKKDFKDESSFEKFLEDVFNLKSENVIFGKDLKKYKIDFIYEEVE